MRRIDAAGLVVAIVATVISTFDARPAAADPVNIAVTTTVDIVDPDDGLTSLAEAAALTESATGPTTIHLEAGETYTLTCGGGSGGALRLEGTEPVTVAGHGAILTSSCSATLISTFPAATPLAVDGLQLVGNGNVGIAGWGPVVVSNSLVNFGVYYGIATAGASITVRDSIVTGTGGVATSLEDPAGTVIIERSTISNGGPVEAFHVSLTDSVVKDNAPHPTLGIGGSGIIARSATIERSRIVGNVGRDVGGVSTSSGTLTIIDSVISDNSATNGLPGAGGVAAFPESGNHLHITGSTISGNSGAFGGVASMGDGASIVRSTVTGNTGSVVGGIAFDSIDDHPRSALRIVSSTIVGNDVVNDRSRAVQVGRFWRGAAPYVDLGRSILGAGALGVPACETSSFAARPEPALGYNFGDRDCLQPDSTDIISAEDPMLGPLADNGRATPTMVPAPDSPVVHRAPFSAPGSTSFDQRGVDRRSLLATTIGATEPMIANPSKAFHPLTPSRVYDSRGGAPLGPGEARTIPVGGLGGVPGTAVDAVVVNITVTNTDHESHLSAGPGDAFVPGAPAASTSVLNWRAADTVAGLVTLTTDASGRISVRNNEGTAHVVVDVSGWYDATGGDGLDYVAPVRVVDTRPAEPLGPGEERVVHLEDLPDGVDAVVVNLTGIAPTSDTHLTIWPADADEPDVSNLNLAAGQVAANLATVRVSPGHDVKVRNNSGETHVTIDLNAAYRPSGTARFHPIRPVRVIDTRSGLGNRGTLGAGTTSYFRFPDGPSYVNMFTGTLTGVAPSEATHVTIAPGITLGQDPPVPDVSSLNLAAGVTRPNGVLSGSGSSSDPFLAVRNNSGTVDVLLDISGWFAPETPH